MVSIARQPAINVGLVEESRSSTRASPFKMVDFQPAQVEDDDIVHMEHVIPIATRQYPGGCLAHPDETKANPLTYFTNH